MAKYKHVKSGSWEQPIRKGYKMVCCDCGLVHTMDFRIFRGRVQMRAERDNPSTKLWRKQNGITVRAAGERTEKS